MGFRRTQRPVPSGGFELYSWLFMRVSGLLLIALVFIHFAIMHVINNVDEINYAFVAKRWANPAWRLYDLLLLTIALAHGVNGLRIIIDDYAHSRFWRVTIISLFYTLALVFLTIGALTIFIFRGNS